jgi:hypothetical protein
VHKLLYTILIACRKLRHYFQAYKISVVMSYPPKAMVHNPNATGNIAKWAVELDFLLCHVFKNQVLAHVWQTGHRHHGTHGARMLVSRRSEPQSSPSLTRRSSSMAPHACKALEWWSCS